MYDRHVHGTCTCKSVQHGVESEAVCVCVCVLERACMYMCKELQCELEQCVMDIYTHPCNELQCGVE